MTRRTTLERLLARVVVDDTNGCWLWTGAKTTAGYGLMKLHGDPVPHYVHRLSYEGHVGPIPVGAVVRHSCDRPVCCFPGHLSTGTQADNGQDAVERNRSTRGVRHGCNKLTEQQVREIRARMNAGERPSALGREFGVTESTPRAIASGKTWGWFQ